jgi:hypothetical protein
MRVQVVTPSYWDQDSATKILEDPRKKGKNPSSQYIIKGKGTQNLTMAREKQMTPAV